MTGQPILPVEEFGYRVISPVVGPDEAIRQVVMAYLRDLEFGIPGGACFNFQEVFSQWPSADTDLPYPCASVVAAGPPVSDEGSWTPRMMEDTWGVFDPQGSPPKSSALWKLGEMTHNLQIDIWTSTFAEQSAAMARMHGAFAPGERAHRVLLTGTPDYWSLRVRAAMRGIERVETEAAMYANEFRARMLVTASIDVAELRCATELRVNPVVIAVGTDIQTQEEN